MECRDIQKKLEAFLDGELTPEESNIISAHLESCPVCQAEFDTLTQVDRLMAETDELDPGPEAWKRMRAGIRHQIGKEKVRERVGILDWIDWLLSPRYAVVKVGAVLAVVVMAFVVSRQLTVEKVIAPTQTVPEYAVPGSAVEGIQKQVPAFIDSVDIESKQIKRGLATEIPEQVAEKSKIESMQMRGSSPVEKGERPARADEILEELPVQTEMESKENGYMGTLSGARDSKDTDKSVTNVGDVLHTLPGVHVDQDSEFHFRGGRSHEVLPSNSGLDSKKAAGGEVPKVYSTEWGTERLQGKSEEQSNQIVRGSEPFSGNEEVLMRSKGPTSLVDERFSTISYWKAYHVTIDSLLCLADDLDSLWYRYTQCDGQPCQGEVAPYLVEALFLRALKSNTEDDIELAMQYMMMHQKRLQETWGIPRFDSRWAKILELEKP